MRPENLAIAKRLSDFYNSACISFVLQGPPGVGKTNETLLWLLSALKNDPGFVGAWIRLEKAPAGAENVMDVYILQQNPENTTAVNFQRIKGVQIIDLLDVLTTEHSCKVVVFDNVNEQNKAPMLRMRQSHDVKVIVASSLQLQADASLSNQMYYTANGWKLSEYLAACANDEFYETVKSNLKTDAFTDEDLNDRSLRTDIVTAKHHIAGGSARWMFDVSADTLLGPDCGETSSIEFHINRTSCENIIAGFRHDRSKTEVNHMMTRIDGKAAIVSQYMAIRMAQGHGEALVRSARQLLSASNPAMDGILMEMEFILKLGRSSAAKDEFVDLITEANTEPHSVFPSGRAVIQYRLKTFADQDMDVRDGDWMVPVVFNNGGFDCVQYQSNKLIFVQVTRSVTHSFKLRWFQAFYNAFIAKFPAKPISSTEVYFVVQEGLVATFAPAAAEGALTYFVKSEFKVVGLRRLEV